MAVLYGGRSSEHDISVQSGRSVVAALDPERYEVVAVEIDRCGGVAAGAPPDEPGESLALARARPGR